MFWLQSAASTGSAWAESPPAPDYATTPAWLSRPSTQGHAVDVFFIHPTSFFAPVIGNARYDQPLMPVRLNTASMRLQAGAFADCCDIWAPQYRQASLKAITTDSPTAYAADDLAYQDVELAFDYFISHSNNRPFILAAHSQGSIHALRLLQQRIIGTPLQRRLIVAYLPGLALPKEIAAHGLPVCDNAAATGCVVSWNTVRSGYDDQRRTQSAVIWWDNRYQPIAGKPMVCVNPVDWRPDSRVEHPGPVSIYARWPGGTPSAPVPALQSATCEADALLGITLDTDYRRHFTDILSVTGVYHDFDYALFFASIADNARTRIASFDKRAISSRR